MQSPEGWDRQQRIIQDTESPSINAALPAPPVGGPDVQAKFYADYLRHRRQEVRFAALTALQKLGNAVATPSVAESVVSTLDEDLIDDRFVALALDVLCACGGVAQCGIPAIVRVAMSSSTLAAAAAKTLLSIGEAGIVALLDVVSGASNGCESVLLYVIEVYICL